MYAAGRLGVIGRIERVNPTNTCTPSTPIAAALPFRVGVSAGEGESVNRRTACPDRANELFDLIGGASG
jgi:hypothetical protein